MLLKKRIPIENFLKKKATFFFYFLEKFLFEIFSRENCLKLVLGFHFNKLDNS